MQTNLKSHFQSRGEWTRVCPNHRGEGKEKKKKKKRLRLVPTKPQRPEPCLPGSHLTKPERQQARDQPGLSDLLDSIHKSQDAGLVCSLLPDMKGHALDCGEDAFTVSQPTLE